MFFPGNPSSAHAPARRARATALAMAAILVLAAALLGLSAQPAAAHTGLDSSDPADGSTSTQPVEAVTLTFTLPVTPLGDAIVITGPDGAVAAEVTQEQDGLLLVATPTAPLDSGEYTVEWTVAAQDGHPLDGTFAFTVDLPGPSPSASVSATSSEAVPSATASSSASGTPTPSASPSPSATAMEAMEDMDDAEVGDALATGLARVGAAIALWALLVGAGALAFAGFAMRGSDAADVPKVIAGVRWCGALLLGGLALRLVGRSALIAGGSFADGMQLDALGDALAGSVVWVFGLQAVGGALMLLGAWRSVAGVALAALGAALAGAGHVMGGHSNTAEPRALVLVADIAHLLAAAVWVGGAVALLAVLRRRRREGRALEPARMAARFGAVAAVAFVVVGVAGVALTWAIVDEPSDLWTTAWGLTLIAKVALVLVVAAIGAYTHFRIVPRLTAREAERSASAGAGIVPGATDEQEHLRRAVAWESALFAAVVLATALLVSASIHV
ncbi:copper resistance CopC/CopD family protein [Demequina salsinemoris]|uniref:copper resistance CopC/CopD family protein n=1 Tax=Demequina salsinemoris TaxID=577470 RepID=UPI0009FFF77A|nr:copper resistance protein CopC [Demequina salsinemoris]